METKDGDVIRSEKGCCNSNLKTFRIQELRKEIFRCAFHQERDKDILNEGLPCEYLSEDGGGWRKARIRLSLLVSVDEDTG